VISKVRGKHELLNRITNLYISITNRMMYIYIYQ